MALYTPNALAACAYTAYISSIPLSAEIVMVWSINAIAIGGIIFVMVATLRALFIVWNYAYPILAIGYIELEKRSCIHAFMSKTRTLINRSLRYTFVDMDIHNLVTVSVIIEHMSMFIIPFVNTCLFAYLGVQPGIFVGN
jgi:hypothetical protein